MNYIATIYYGEDNHSMSFKSISAAERWLDENNNNLEHTTTIDEYDDNWVKCGSFTYTKGKEQ